MKIVSSLAIIAAIVAQPSLASDAHHKPAQGAAATQAAPMTEGEVRKIDKAARKITLKLGAIRNLDMPPMTMVFNVADPALLEKFKAGDKVRFSAAKTGDGFAVTRIEHQK